MKKCFDGFCQDGSIHVDTIGTILTMMGLRVKPSALREIIEEVSSLSRNQKFFVVLILNLFKAINSQGIAAMANNLQLSFYFTSAPTFLFVRISRRKEEMVARTEPRTSQS